MIFLVVLTVINTIALVVLGVRALKTATKIKSTEIETNKISIDGFEVKITNNNLSITPKK